MRFQGCVKQNEETDQMINALNLQWKIESVRVIFSPLNPPKGDLFIYTNFLFPFGEMSTISG
jgi:hypothetical protein